MKKFIRSIRKKRSITGFFLMDLLISLALLGIFSVGSVVVIATQIEKAQDAKIKSDLVSIRTALHEYYEDQNCFPLSLPACGQPLTYAGKVYFVAFPCHPNKTAYVYQREDTVCSSWFKVVTNLGNEKDKSIDAVGCRYGCGPLCTHNYGVSSTNKRLNDNCPVPTPTPTMQVPTPTVPQGTPPPGTRYFACAPPAGKCIEYSDPSVSSCPRVFFNDPTCEALCEAKSNQCKNEKGKKH